MALTFQPTNPVYKLVHGMTVILAEPLRQRCTRYQSVSDVKPAPLWFNRQTEKTTYLIPTSAPSINLVRLREVGEVPASVNDDAFSSVCRKIFGLVPLADFAKELWGLLNAMRLFSSHKKTEKNQRLSSRFGFQCSGPGDHLKIPSIYKHLARFLVFPSDQIIP